MNHISYRCSPAELKVIKKNADAAGLSIYGFAKIAACVLAGHMNITRDYRRFKHIENPRTKRAPMSIRVSPGMYRIITKVASDAGISPSLFVRYSAISFNDFNLY